MNIELLKQSSILYVEDDLSVSSVFCAILESSFKKIYAASNGAEGLEFYLKYKDKIDVIVTDLNMPKVSGIEMIKRIREISYDVPIIITSAFGDERSLKQIVNLGVDGFLNKPLVLDDLLKIIERVLKPIFYQKELQKKDALIFQQAKLAAIGEMIGNIAHQWRQPLNSIGVTMMKLEFNNENDTLTKEIVSDSIDKTNSIIGHMSKTIDDFRNFFSPTKEKKEFLIRDNIQSMLSLVLPQLANHNIDITVNGDRDIKIFGYENELKQVLINIVSNAKDAIVNSCMEFDGVIKIDIETKTNNLIVNISDNAGGIPIEVFDKVFEPYFTTKFKSQGTGLGLYMSKVIIEKNMKGTLTVHNNEEGAIFTIILPLS
ncbi:MAG: hybrid sensor histidine kinase/response regulator [Campylobacterota bacterium]|nr:hybrid sensor histidine kinase/response regulator [Campylobacterota bacterium]